jgi:hypothetical protein
MNFLMFRLKYPCLCIGPGFMANDSAIQSYYAIAAK